MEIEGRMNKLLMQCIIDTMSVVIEFENSYNIIVPEHMKEYVTQEIDKVEKGKKIIKFNPHMTTGKYKKVGSLKELKNIMEEVLEQLSVINQKEVKLNRIDIAIDSDLNFNDNFKFLLMFFDLYTFKKSNKDRWYTVNLDTLDKSTIIYKNTNMEVVFYDKEAESGGNHEFSTRMEVRFKRLSKMDFEKNLDKVIDSLKDLEEKMPLLEEDMAKRLVKLWEKESKKGKIKTFSEFVRKYDDYFYTTNVIKIVYKESGLKGSCSNWVKKYRLTNNLEFYSKSNVVKLKKQMIKSIKTYKKS